MGRGVVNCIQVSAVSISLNTTNAFLFDISVDCSTEISKKNALVLFKEILCFVEDLLAEGHAIN